MRIAIVVEAVPPRGGGGEQVAWTHAAELAKRHEVALVTFAGERDPPSAPDGATLHRLPRAAHGLLAYATTHRAVLNRCLDRLAPDVVHCHMPNVLSACLAKRHRFLVVTLHDGVPEHERFERTPAPWRARARFRLLRRVNLHKADAITCVSRFGLDVTRALYPQHATKLELIANPIAERFFAPTADRDDGYVLNFGRQIELKMAPLLEVARQMPSTRFVFVGEGDQVRNHGLPNVEFAGFSAAVERYIDAAALCVFPSLSENLPLVGLEAMARGKPVLATRRGFSEYIEHGKNGLLLESAEPGAVRAGIERLLARPELRASLGRAARVTAERFRPAQVVEQYERLYRRALSGSPASLSVTET